MIKHKYSVSAVLLGAPLLSAALELREQPARPVAAEPLAVAPAESPDGRARLRDSLRQPLAEGDAASKPFRLSAEERQRLREQLRGLPERSAKNK
ncbi:hypothetical protein [Hydrogenophaga pseudoflava]|uniref:hypothetical protein n=1 Tax=Hydrogenophaga pseudoflava TaxID=47421 RepID=UPI0027E52C0A|nr:hypothetical protein [Hydrogenophaga pseudoflava]MDQ7746558.1 hypothetical protein [Hydrogenophaga pseudoflava]